MSIEKTLSTEKQSGNGWYSLVCEEVVHQLKSSTDKGLASSEAEHRLQSNGPNQLTEAKPITFWQMVWEQLNSFVIWLLIGASLISAFLGDYVEAGVIIAIVVLNTVLGVLQEQRAEQALSALKKMAAPEAHVIRDGHRQSIPASQLVPGDLVLLEAGNFVPADIRLIETVNLRIDESALTGESVPAQKDASIHLRQDVPLGDQKNTAFMSTVVNYGRGKGFVVSTGMHTQIGMIAQMLQSVDREQTPLQRKLEQLGKSLGMAAIIICVLVFLLGWLQGNAPLDMFMIAIG
jgi:Ca2+-transporting ATPase